MFRYKVFLAISVFLTLVLAIVYWGQASHERVIVLQPEQTWQNINYGLIEDAYVGQEYIFDVWLLNPTNDPIYLELGKSCSCTSATFSSNPIMPRKKSKVTARIKLSKGIAGNEKQLKVVNLTTDKLHHENNYNLAIAFSLDVTKVLGSPNRLTFGRQAPPKGHVERKIRLQNLSDDNISLTSVKEPELYFRVDMPKSFILAPKQAAMIPVVLTDQWSGNEFQSEELVFNVKIKEQEWAMVIPVDVAPIPDFIFTPSSLLITNESNSEIITKEIKISRNNTNLGAVISGIDFDKTLMDVKKTDSSAYLITVFASEWLNRGILESHIIFECSKNGFINEIKIPVILVGIDRAITRG